MANKFSSLSNLRVPKPQGTIGEGLLSETSKRVVAADYTDMHTIKLDEISLSNKHRKSYSMDEGAILGLMVSIRIIGLQQNLVVIKTPNGERPYRLTTGHRRYEALTRLRKEGAWGDSAACIVVDLNRIKLPLTDEEKEELLVRETNSNMRDYTDADLLGEVKFYDEIYTKLRKEKVEFVEMPDGRHLVIKGTKNRELIAETLKSSPAKIGQFKTLINQGSETLQEAVKEGKISVSTAMEIKNLPEKEQKEIIKTASKEDSTVKTKHIEKVAQKASSKIKLPVEEFEETINKIKSIIQNKREIEMTETQNKNYLKAIQTIETIFKG